jgi:hypothetical protein
MPCFDSGWEGRHPASQSRPKQFPAVPAESRSVNCGDCRECGRGPPSGSPALLGGCGGSAGCIIAGIGIVFARVPGPIISGTVGSKDYKTARYHHATAPGAIASSAHPAVLVRQRLRHRHQIVNRKRVETHDRRQSRGMRTSRGNSKVPRSQRKKWSAQKLIKEISRVCGVTPCSALPRQIVGTHRRK